MTKKYDRKKYLDKSIGIMATSKDIKRGFSLYRRQNASQTTVKGRSSIKKNLRKYEHFISCTKQEQEDTQ